MRVWIKPDRLAKLGLTPADVISAIKEQNLQAPAGKVGGAPTPTDQEFTETLSAPGRLITPEEFENVIVRQTGTGAVVRVKDVGRAEMGSQDYNSFGRLNGKPGGAMAVLSAARREPAKAAGNDLRDDGTREGPVFRPTWITRSSTTRRRQLKHPFTKS
jgi:HAE1 family hydrophobic/amphiphilic exporter-1